jgi:hypothetical protein
LQPLIDTLHQNFPVRFVGGLGGNGKVQKEGIESKSNADFTNFTMLNMLVGTDYESGGFVNENDTSNNGVVVNIADAALTLDNFLNTRRQVKLSNKTAIGRDVCIAEAVAAE